ncbi:TPA: isochorismatase family protein [Staphylococcus delphini]|nr:isochorismatase family protein [Staphylococcus delphini]HEC2209575.1 isochorismatase family protein [Staphylococcus delphini]HEC2218200.1 isochorismatase family protein [Staphylococcus delphini]HEC2229708.1 isochorismatase family protein [Staphylococcus delphini]HEC2245832.1 isochorismatase family protein [Staphylococcus delphini]
MIDYKKTALVLIDLQKGILSMETQPNSTDFVVENAAKMIKQFREHGGFIAFVRVKFHDGYDALSPRLAVQPLPGKPGGDFSDFPFAFNITDDDYIINKRGFSAFFGTDLDLQLRRRGIENIILGGISTHMGVDTTARDAYQYGYEQYFVTDMMSAPTVELHTFSIDNSFPIMGEVTTVDSLINP